MLRHVLLSKMIQIWKKSLRFLPLQCFFGRRARQSIKWIIFIVFLFYLIMYIGTLNRKSRKAARIISYLRKYRHLVSMGVIRKSPGFAAFVRQLKSMKKPAFVLLSNKHALDLTFNHLCNIVEMNNVQERLAIVVLDTTTYNQMAMHYPKIERFLFNSDRLKGRFRGEYSMLAQYQLFFLFRANLAAALARAKVPFWMIQQDTLWRSNLDDFNLEMVYERSDLIVDRIGNEQMTLYKKRDGWINGATYFVRGNTRYKMLMIYLLLFVFFRSAVFFELLANKLQRWCAPDSAIMTYLCMSEQPSGIRCSSVPYGLMSSSDWLYTDRSEPPHFLQIDHITSDEKMQTFARYGLLFLEKDRRSCNREAVKNAKKLLRAGIIFSDRQFDWFTGWKESWIDLFLCLIPGGRNFYRKYMFLTNYGDRL